ncbi:tri m 2 allergen [Alternaria sp. MG1]|uniref:Peptidase S8/S53 domain-containing protein n=1 Tax=Alternaria tenuissima TaxID=119927 RepID=A0A4Q4P2M1_9PLEO|nr:peptidase S8/S53 domain-containing protein [Alternaria alternata]RII09847.1 tri m 2 allergen [Alternaria sp. MG1]RYN16952.1 hypothetical protein AA0115_g12051 [Alternaria tenuissima]RYN47741.1 hypothetical protein AA0114_g7582 [Alternaria tenuissima]RYN90077.1 hypothetical protein AA0119_g11263 [Alternaria tenuissima]
MVYVSHVTLAAIAVFLTHLSVGAAETQPVVHLHQRMNSNDQPGAEAVVSNDSFNPGVKQSCDSVAVSAQDSTKNEACEFNPDGTPVQTVPEDTKKRAKRDEDTPRPYLVTTVDGITQAQYEEFAKKPPLGDKQGDIIAFDEVEWVSCQYLNLTDAEAAIVRQDPIIAWAEPMSEEDGEALVIPNHGGTNSLYTRATLPQSLSQRDDSAAHLRLLSARNQKNDPAQLPNYVFEPSLGQGQTIYVLDTGYRKSHQEFDASEREVRDFVVPNRHTLALGSLSDDQKGPEDMTDINGHGTMVASIVAGYISGVASKANLVVVKMRNWAKNPQNPESDKLVPRGVTDSGLEFALSWTFKDIEQQRRQNTDPNAKYVINLSYGWIKEIAQGKINIMERALRKCKDKDITLVIAAGNEGAIRTLDTLTPQAFGTDDRFSMITVGGVDQAGRYYRDTVQGNGQGGQVDIYADAVNVVAAKHDGEDDSTTSATGTSAAAPAIAGLAAYFFSIPELRSNWRDGSVPADMKAFILKNAEIRNDDPFNGDEYENSPKPEKDSLKVPYNLALNQLCDLPDTNAKRSLFTKRAPTPEQSVPGRPIVENSAVTNEDLKNEICNVHNRPAESEPEPEPEQPEQPDSPPPPPPNTASCKVLEQGLGGGKWEVTGSGWGDEGSLKEKFGDDSFSFTGGDTFTATFLSGMSVEDIENAVREMSGLGDVTCST